MKKSIKPVKTEKPQNAAVEAVKDKTPSPVESRRKARLFQLSVGIMLAASALKGKIFFALNYPIRQEK